MSVLAEVEVPPQNGTEEIPQPEKVNARWLLDTAIEKADAESADGLFFVYLPVVGRKITMRRLNFDELTEIRAVEDSKQGNRMMIQRYIVEPPFSMGEVEEVMTNPKLVPVAIILNNAVNRINHLTEAQQQVIDAKFRAD